MTDVTGAMFVSYRRSPGRRSGDAEADRVRDALHDRGIPTWRDRDDLRPVPTEEELRRILRSDGIAGAVMLVSPEVEESETIREIEAPEIFDRVGRNDGFFVQIVSIHVPYGDVDRVLGRAGGLQDVSRFNMELIEKDSLEAPDARRIASAVLKQRLAAVRRAAPTGPVSVTLDSRRSGPATGLHLRHDFTRYFNGREATPRAYPLIETALLDTATALADTGDRSAVRARGLAALPLGVLFGAVYSRFSFNLSWMQPAPDGSEGEWSLRSGVDEIDTTVRPICNSLGSEELVLAVSVSADVESAVADYLSTTKLVSPGHRRGEADERATWARRGDHGAARIADRTRGYRRRAQAERQSRHEAGKPSRVSSRAPWAWPSS